MKRWEFLAVAAAAAILAVVALPDVIVAAAARDARPPRNTIDCSAFKKQTDGTWHVESTTTFRIGRFRKTTFSQLSIGPRFYTFGGADLYRVLENKCRTRASATAN